MTEFTPCQKDALDVSRSVGVTASAGTGKTFLLQNRFVKLLVEKDVRPHQILCLTYTEKAAAEMQDKIEQELRKQSDAEIKRRMDGGMTREEAEENKLTKALGSIHQCTISTFHGFCSGLLHEFPIEAKVPISYSIMDSLAEHDLVTSTIADTLHHPDEALWEHVTLLFRSFSRENDLSDAVKKFLYGWETYAPWFEHLKEHPEDVVSEWNAWKTELIESSWQDVVNDSDLRAYNEIENTNPKSKENAQKTREIYQRLPSASTLEEKRLILKEFAEQKNPKGKIYHGLNDHYEEVRNRIGKFIDSAEIFAPDDVNSQCMVSVLLAFAAVTAHVHTVIRERKREGGYLDFADLISHVKDLLDHNESICRELRARYHYILVDEVQDNDPILTMLVRTLAEDTKTNDKLFAVGDMKQAIYGFRGADPGGFRDILGDFGQKPVELDVNYRTVPFLIDVINTVFSRIYAPGNQDGIPYTNVTANRRTDIGSFTILHNPKRDSHPKEWERLASWIHDRITGQDLEVCDSVRDEEGNVREVPRKASYRDIAILVRSKRSINYLIPALKAYNVPYHVYKGNGFYDEQEISDLMNVIRASVFHGNEPALYGALISPYFGISDEQLAVALTAVSETEDGPYDPQERKYNDRLWTRLSKSSDLQIQAALKQLDNFRRASATLPVSAFIRRIVQDTGILSVYSALENGIDMIRNIRKFLDAAISLEAGKEFGIMDFIQTIETCISESIKDEIGAPEPDTDAEDRIQIMTVHVSKGLEYKVVVLFGTGKYYSNKSDIPLCHPKYHYGCRKLSIPANPKVNIFGFLDYLIDEDQKQKVEADERRLFYVGMTRPRDHLVMTYSANPMKNSFMKFYQEVDADVPAETIDVCEHYPPESGDTDENLQAARRRVLENLQSGLQISYPEEKAVISELFRYGSCIHELFEGREEKRTVCRRYGYDDTELAEFERIIASFRNHPFLAGIDKEWHELSFTNGHGETRRADMLVRYTDGTYRIIDFKSDDFHAIPDDRRTKYLEQLKEYAKCLGDIFGTGDPIPACFYATKDGVFIELDDILTYKK